MQIPEYEPIKVSLIDWLGDDLSVVNAARVSFDRWKDEKDSTDKKLISYLASHNHDSPFAHTSATFRVTAPIFVARQLFKHKVGFAENEISRRYVSSPPTFWAPSEWRQWVANKKQGSGEPITQQPMANRCYQELCEAALRSYINLLELDVAPEMARCVLPVCTMTTWIWTSSVLGFARAYRLRTSSDAQKEAGEVMYLIGADLRRLYPWSWAALVDGA